MYQRSIRFGTIIRISIALVWLLLASSCITNKSMTYLQDSDKLPQYPKVPYTYYRIQKNDQLVIRLLSLNEEATAIFNMQSTSASTTGYTYRVYDDGTIDIPFVDNIPVAGLTIREASKVIEARLKDFVPDAMVKVALANDNFYMLGLSGSKGAFPLYKEKLNIFQALALTGNVATNADRKRVRLIRPNADGGRPIVKEFDLRTISIIDSEYYYVQPNDVLYLGPIKGDFWKIENYSSAVGTLSTSLSFLVTVLNLGLTFK